VHPSQFGALQLITISSTKSKQHHGRAFPLPSPQIQHNQSTTATIQNQTMVALPHISPNFPKLTASPPANTWQPSINSPPQTAKLIPVLLLPCCKKPKEEERPNQLCPCTSSARSSPQQQPSPPSSSKTHGLSPCSLLQRKIEKQKKKQMKMRKRKNCKGKKKKKLQLPCAREKP
jgi:hypothetical protein